MSDYLSSCVLSKEESEPRGGSPVLIIEEDHELAEEIGIDLRAGGHTVQFAETLTDGLHAVRSSGPSALVIDRNLNGEDGLSIVETLRGEGKSTPALMISGPTSVDEQIAGLKAGCDDYFGQAVRYSGTDRAGGGAVAPRRRLGCRPAQGGRFGNGLNRPNSQVRRHASRSGSHGIQAARVLHAPSKPNCHSSDAARGCLEFSASRLHQRRRCADRQFAPQARPDANRRVIASVRSVGFKLNMDH